jgi:hypothetical protein
MKKLLVLFLFICLTIPVVNSQENKAVNSADSLKVVKDSSAVVAETKQVSEKPQEAPAGPARVSKNFIKFNITAAFLKNYSIQYERALSKGISMAVSFRMMPETGLPYTDNIFRWFDITDPEEQDIIKNLTLENLAITPEIRFYTGKKGYGNGFYFSLFYRYGQYTVNNVELSYENDLGEETILSTSGNITAAHTGGFMLGAQWSLGKHVCLDWWILGPHFGVSSGDMLALSSVPLTEEEQQDIEDELNGIDIPMFKQTVNVTSAGASMVFDGPWAGIRAGLSLGIKF